MSTAAPVIQDDLGASVTELQLIVNVFVVALSTGMVTAGRLADGHGRRKVLYAGAAVFGVASLFAGLAGTAEWLILFRFLQGAACAVLYTSTGALVSAIFPRTSAARPSAASTGSTASAWRWAPSWAASSSGRWAGPGSSG
ncbi:MFS transporter [Streptomyces sudanensis]|nr:MFS transporter [Streptomyces sudanensis]MCP9987574.1 MFS transporter [Streptomyces sudanensis]